MNLCIRGWLTLLVFSNMYASTAATYGGGCYYFAGLKLSTCEEVEVECSTDGETYCYSYGGVMNYYCGRYGCSGYWESSSSGSYYAGSGSSYADAGSSSYDLGVDPALCDNLEFASCYAAEADLFSRTDCSCYTCNQYTGPNGADTPVFTSNVYMSCTSPRSCTRRSTSDSYDIGFDTINAMCAVYLVVAFVHAVGAMCAKFLCCAARNETTGQSIKEVVRKRLPFFSRCVYTALLQSFVSDDGSGMHYANYVCDKRDILGSVFFFYNKPQSIRPVWIRVVALLTAFAITVSLGFSLGTFIHNNEACRFSGGVTCGGVSSSVTVYCELPDAATRQRAYWLTAALTLAVSRAFATVVAAAHDSLKLQIRYLLMTMPAASGLVVFGVEYAELIAKEEVTDDTEAGSRRQDSILTTILMGWGFEQILGTSLAYLEFLLRQMCYNLLYRPMLEQAVKEPGAAAVHPQENQGFDSVVVDVQAPQDTKSMAISGVDRKKGSIENIKLEPPSRDEQA